MKKFAKRALIVSVVALIGSRVYIAKNAPAPSPTEPVDPPLSPVV